MPYKLADDGLTVLVFKDGKWRPAPGGKHRTHKGALKHLQALVINVTEAGAGGGFFGKKKG